MKNAAKIIAVVAVIGFAGISWALPNGVKYTPHNLGTTGKGRFSGSGVGITETEICVFCHTPHNAAAGQKFLWNRIATAGGFALYTSSPTLNISVADKAAGISEVSKMCMTCHDGATAMNSMANPRSGIPNDINLGDVWDPADPIVQEWGKNIGERGGYISGDTIPNTSNLTNDHPISFSYVNARTNEGAGTTLKDINAADGPKANGLVFWGQNGDMLECVTCHDPHVNYGSWDYRQPVVEDHSLGTFDRSLAPFLRRSNSSSRLCFSCHDK